MATNTDLAERVSALEVDVERLVHTIEGNGQQGLDRIMRDYIATQKGAEEERNRRQSRRDWIIMAVLAALSIGIAVMGYKHEIEKDAILQQIQSVQQDRPQQGEPRPKPPIRDKAE